jgi:hypothetical protein
MAIDELRAIDVAKAEDQATGHQARLHRLGVPRRRRGLVWSCAATSAFAVIAGLAVQSAVTWGLSERTLSTSWHRAVEAEGNRTLDFDRTSASLVVPVSSGDTAKSLIVGERVTLVTPDGNIHNLRVCDPASPTASMAPDCLAGFAARAVVAPSAPVPQRSL